VVRSRIIGVAGHIRHELVGRAGSRVEPAEPALAVGRGADLVYQVNELEVVSAAKVTTSC